jgi:predicted transcriptional regulator
VWGQWFSRGCAGEVFGKAIAHLEPGVKHNPQAPGARRHLGNPAGVAQPCYIAPSEAFAVSTTTTIRIDDELKARAAAAAERLGKTPHAFIVEAIARQVEQAEEDAAFHREADSRWAKVLSSGSTVPWDKARAYLEARARGAKARRPSARKIDR